MNVANKMNKSMVENNMKDKKTIEIVANMCSKPHDDC